MTNFLSKSQIEMLIGVLLSMQEDVGSSTLKCVILLFTNREKTMSDSRHYFKKNK